MRSGFAILWFPLMAILTSCGGDGPTGTYDLTSTSNLQGCLPDFTDWAAINTGSLPARSTIGEVTKLGDRSLRVALNGTSGPVLILDSTGSDTTLYQGIRSQDTTVRGCFLSEDLSATLVDFGDHIRMTLLDQLRVVPLDVTCEWTEGSCENSFQWVGNRK